MVMFKRCLQRLRHSARSVRLIQCIIALSCIAVVLGVILNVKKSSTGKLQKISCVKDSKVVLYLDCPGAAADIISIPLVRATTHDRIPFLDFLSNDEKWKTTALYSESIGELMGELSLVHLKDPTPLIAFVQDAQGDEYFIMIGSSGESTVSSLQYLFENSLIKTKESGKKKFLGLKTSFHPTGEGQVTFYIQQQFP